MTITLYFRLREPFTSMAVEREGSVSRIQLGVAGEEAGTLAVREQDVAGIVLALSQWDTEHPAMVSIEGDKHTSIEQAPNLHPDAMLISDRGEVFTVAQIRAMAKHEEDLCGRPCDPNNACEECAPYWQRMEAEGFWDRGRHRWTAKGWKEITK